MKGKSMNFFNQVARPQIPKSVQDLSHEFKFSCNMGELIPVVNIDCIPGDRVHLDNEALVRFMPMVAPVFDRFDVTFHRWFVPKRLLWDHWDEYVSLTKIGSPAALPVHPYFDLDPADMDIANYIRLANYMGIPLRYDPVGQSEVVRLNPMRFAAYQFIYNENYRDQNLVAPIDYKLSDGAVTDMTEFFTLRKRAWSHDYFTGGLPFTQKGDPVLMPSSFKDVPVKANEDIYGAGTQVEWNATKQPGGTGTTVNAEIEEPDFQDPADPGLLYADTSQLELETTINDLRTANAIQRFQERLMRVGSRFTEFLKGVFDIRSRDSRLQRPEYVGGVIKPVTISEVLQTSETATSPQGNMAGHGATYISGKKDSYFVEEHGYIIVIMNIQPKGTYFQGIDKEFLKINHPTEIYTPDLANLGEQETLREEIYAYTASGTEPFNYNPRWTEHRFIPNRVGGQLAIETKLMHWHAGRLFSAMPNFNQSFIEMTGSGSSDRIFTVTDAEEEKLLVQLWNTVQMIRPIPKLGTPAL